MSRAGDSLSRRWDRRVAERRSQQLQLSDAAWAEHRRFWLLSVLSIIITVLLFGCALALLSPRLGGAWALLLATGGSMAVSRSIAGRIRRRALHLCAELRSRQIP